MALHSMLCVQPLTQQRVVKYKKEYLIQIHVYRHVPQIPDAKVPTGNSRPANASSITYILDNRQESTTWRIGCVSVPLWNVNLPGNSKFASRDKVKRRRVRACLTIVIGVSRECVDLHPVYKSPLQENLSGSARYFIVYEVMQTRFHFHFNIWTTVRE